MVFTTSDYKFMTQALELAGQAQEQAEVPVGAVLVDADGKVLAVTANAAESLGCQTGHAEVLAIQKACQKLESWRLDGCTLYVSLEPCLMCFGLISLSRISKLVYGCSSPLFGFSKFSSDYDIYQKNLEIRSGLLEQQASAMLQDFFNKVRNQGHKNERKAKL